MLPITKMLDINVKIQAASLSRLAFGVPLIFDTENVLNASPTEGIVRSFTSLSDMVDAGYQPYNAAYKQAKIMLAQQPHPAVFKVGCSGADGSATLDYIVAVDSEWFLLLVSDYADTTNTAAADWCLTQNGEKFYVAGLAAATAVATAETLLGTSNPMVSPWYIDTATQVRTIKINKPFDDAANVTITVNGVATAATTWDTDNATTLDAFATAIEALDSVATAVSDGVDTITVTSNATLNDLVFSAFTNSGDPTQKAAYATVSEAASPIDAALVGIVAPKTPGSLDACWKALIGCQSQTISSSLSAELDAVNCNYYTSIGGRVLTYRGVCSAMVADGVPLFADLVWGKAGLQADLTATLADALTAQDKLPYNDSGIGAVVGCIGNVGKRWVSKGFLEPFNSKTAITYPKGNEIPPSERSSRVLNGITAQFVATGSIQKVGLNVTIQA